MNRMMKALAYVLAVATVTLTSYFLGTPLQGSPQGNQGRNITLNKR